MNVKHVYHLAAESRLQPAIENPIQAVYRNCVGTPLFFSVQERQVLKDLSTPPHPLVMEIILFQC